MSTILDKIHSAMTTKAITPDEIKLANEMIASYLQDSAAALEQAKEVARQSGIPFKFDISGLLVAFDPAKEEAELKAEEQARKDADSENDDDDDWDPSDDWDSSDSTC